MYAIRGLCHRSDIDMGAHGFCIDLSPRWKDAVSKSGLTEEKISKLLENCGRTWLDRAGFDGIFDPDNCGFERDVKAKPGPNARPMYEPNHDLLVRWGEWGPEHITVPGNACGLDIERSSFANIFEDGQALVPHNIDGWRQKYLLLIVFTEIAETVILLAGRSRAAHGGEGERGGRGRTKGR